MHSSEIHPSPSGCLTTCQSFHSNQSLEHLNVSPPPASVPVSSLHTPLGCHTHLGLENFISSCHAHALASLSSTGTQRWDHSWNALPDFTEGKMGSAPPQTPQSHTQMPKEEKSSGISRMSPSALPGSNYHHFSYMCHPCI